MPHDSDKWVIIQLKKKNAALQKENAELRKKLETAERVIQCLHISDGLAHGSIRITPATTEAQREQIIASIQRELDMLRGLK